MPRATPLSILVLGASYGLLPATRIALSGHDVTVVCRAEEAARIADTGVSIHLPERGIGQGADFQAGQVFALHCAAQLGEGSADHIGFVTPEKARPERADMIILAMQEPQFAAPEIADLTGRIARSGVPVLSLQNMPPPPFLKRIGFDTATARHAYSASQVWAAVPADHVTLASPDAQAVRTDPRNPGALTITLATNFKVAPFANPSAQAVLERITTDIDASRPQGRRPSVRLVASPSLYAPLAKWPMLISGNCRCLRAGGPPVSIAEAVHADLDVSRDIYDWVVNLAAMLGAPRDIMVPFDRYATVARELTLPSSLARGLAAGAPAVERIDLLLAAVAKSVGQASIPLDPITDLIERQLRTAHRVA